MALPMMLENKSGMGSSITKYIGVRPHCMCTDHHQGNYRLSLIECVLVMMIITRYVTLYD